MRRLYWSFHQYFLWSASRSPWGKFGCGDIISCRVKCLTAKGERVSNRNTVFVLSLVRSVLIGDAFSSESSRLCWDWLFLVLRFQRGASVFYCQQMSSSFNVFFVFHLKDIRLVRDFPGLHLLSKFNITLSWFSRLNINLLELSNTGYWNCCFAYIFNFLYSASSKSFI